MPGEPLMTLELLRPDHPVRIIVSEMMVLFMFGRLLGFFLVLFGLALLIILNRLQDVIFLHWDPFNAFHFVSLDENENSRKDGHQTTQCDEQACAPTRTGETAPVPHPNTQADLEKGVEHVHPSDEIEVPGFGWRGSQAGQWGFRHGRRGQRYGRVCFQLSNLLLCVGWRRLWRLGVLFVVYWWWADVYGELVRTGKPVPASVDTRQAAVEVVVFANAPAQDVV